MHAAPVSKLGTNASTAIPELCLKQEREHAKTPAVPLER